MRFAGCTLVFSQVVFRDCMSCLLGEINQIHIPHDQFVLATCLAGGGAILLDHTPHIKYRRSSNSVTSGGRGIVQRLRYEWTRLITCDRLDLVSKLFLDRGVSSSENFNYLNVCSKYKSSFYWKLKLVIDTLGSAGNPILDCEALFKIIISTF
jgi:hypothetical protein